MNVALYARVSTRDKEQNPETQLRPSREHVSRLDDVKVVGEFVDKAGADDLRGRRQWRRLLDLVSRHQVDLIVVWKLDRAFRSVVDGATTLQSLRSSGCGIRSLQEPRPTQLRPLTEHPHWAKVLRALEAGHTNRTEAAKKLHVRKSVLIAALRPFPKGGGVPELPADLEESR